MTFEELQTQESAEQLEASAPEIEKNIVNPDKLKSLKAKTLALAMAMLTQSACLSVQVGSGSRTDYGNISRSKYEQNFEMKPRSPSEYCNEIDRAISSPRINDYKKEIRTPQGMFILRGVEDRHGNNMTVTFIPPRGPSQRIVNRYIK